MSIYFDFDIQFKPGSEPRVLARNLELLDDALGDFFAPLVAAGQIVVEDIEDHFMDEQGPDRPWEPWADSYKARAERENKGILRKTEALFDAATDESNYPITGNELFVSTGNFPDYWEVHQQGGFVMTSKAIHARRKQRSGGERGTHGRIPERPFIFRSAEADAQIGVVFNEWMENTMTLYVKPTGQVQARLPAGSGVDELGRKTGGRFSRRIGTH